jgi:glycerophosphoryl diester phosphodiesterase
VKRSQIFAHRGFWKEGVSDPNSQESLNSAFEEGFAVETDVRDQQKEIVISHDPCGSSIYNSFNRELLGLGRIAINIKSDGLVPRFTDLTEHIRDSQSFVFDCSFPQILQFRNASIPHALRISEFERELPWKPEYIWLDAFNDDWWIKDVKIRKMMDEIPTIIVSPELHGRDFLNVWEEFSGLTKEVESIGICTDFPHQLSSSLGIS